MKRFLLQSLVFTFFTTICFIIFWLIVCSNRDKALKLPDNTNIVFLGNSHFSTGINDTIIQKSFNFARSADNLEHTYIKVKLLKKYNPNIDTIIISYDDNMMNNLDFVSGMNSPIFYDFYSFRDIYSLFKFSNREYISEHIAYPFDWFKLLQIFTSEKITDMTNIGGDSFLYQPLNDSSMTQRKVYTKDKFDDLSICFLDKIVNFCDKNNICLIFMYTPMHKKFIQNKYFYKQFYNNNYSQIKFYDFRNKYLADSCFRDLHHLNYKGAKVFSEFLEKEVLHKQNYPIK